MKTSPQSDAEPQTLLRELRGRVSDRKLRLFSLACVRRFGSFLAHPRLEQTREALHLLELHLDGRAALAEFLSAQTAALREIERNVADQAVANWTGSDMAHVLLANDAERAASRHIDLTQDFAFDVVVDRFPESMTDDEAWEAVTTPVRAQLCGWLRDVAGEQASYARFRPEWRTPDAVAMAEEMYARGDFVALPVLAEALREGGCDDPVLLGHCQGPAEHIRGCWVMDLVLGRA